MDILPSGNIFRELQDIHDTGYFSAQPSLEDHWQQIYNQSYRPSLELEILNVEIIIVPSIAINPKSLGESELPESQSRVRSTFCGESARWRRAELFVLAVYIAITHFDSTLPLLHTLNICAIKFIMADV
ncbi:Krueppel-like factor 6 isoform X2 [Vespula maculifrons]|uniref:Krueppel-like factor 6 isoform X2 n=1 Tax=Vespula maculifrons TaxID=7453 RepID=A0ABD2AQQ0_VESMC